MRPGANVCFQIVALSFIALSFAFCSFVIALVTGLEAVPDFAVDSAGRTMGFNDRLSPEHYAIALSNFSLWNLLNPESAYCLLLLGMHLWAGRLIFSFSKTNPHQLRRFFLAQALIFPLGWIGVFVLPWALQSMFSGTMDREGIIDIPFIALTAHPVWIATAMSIFFTLRNGSRPILNSGSEHASQTV